jgi:amino acid transporter
MLSSASKIEPAEATDVCQEDQMIVMGYKQELVRGMDSFMSFTIGFTEVSAIISITSILTYGLTTGGPLMMTWGWLITFVMTMIIGLNFAEICSVFPVAGSVYHW